MCFSRSKRVVDEKVGKILKNYFSREGSILLLFSKKPRKTTLEVSKGMKIALYRTKIVDTITKDINLTIEKKMK